MLWQVEITNVALIDFLCIEFGAGMNVLTGETGAGKSIIIDSINAVLGGRINKELIKTGCESASVTAVFIDKSVELNDYLTDIGISTEEDGTIVITRDFSLQGRNVCRVNGKIVTVTVLKEIGKLLIDIHGQHDNQSLLNEENHIKLLDTFGGNELIALKSEYSGLLSSYKEICSEINKINGDARAREQRTDLLKYQVNEIRKAELKEDEEEELLSKRKIINSAEKIISALNLAFEALYETNDETNTAYDLIKLAEKSVLPVARLDEKYENIRSRLEELSYNIEDIADIIRIERDKVDFEPGEAEEIDDRLDLIHSLKRKYGQNIKEILEYCESS